MSYATDKCYFVQIKFPHKKMYILDAITITQFKGMAMRMTLIDALKAIKKWDMNDTIKYKAVYRPAP